MTDQTPSRPALPSVVTATVFDILGALAVGTGCFALEGSTFVSGTFFALFLLVLVIFPASVVSTFPTQSRVRIDGIGPSVRWFLGLSALWQALVWLAVTGGVALYACAVYLFATNQLPH